MLEIDIINRHGCSLDTERLRQRVEAVLTRRNVATACLSVTITTDPEIHAINRQYLDHDYPTDVITFDLSDEGSTDDFPAIAEALNDDDQRSEEADITDGPPASAGSRRMEGEIVVSADTAVRSAAELDRTFESELTLYVIHGILHLLGFDDRTESDRAEMRRQEKQVLTTIYGDDADGEPPSGEIREGSL